MIPSTIVNCTPNTSKHKITHASCAWALIKCKKVTCKLHLSKVLKMINYIIYSDILLGLMHNIFSVVSRFTIPVANCFWRLWSLNDSWFKFCSEILSLSFTVFKNVVQVLTVHRHLTSSDYRNQLTLWNLYFEIIFKPFSSCDMNWLAIATWHYISFMWILLGTSRLMIEVVISITCRITAIVIQ